MTRHVAPFAIALALTPSACNDEKEDTTSTTSAVATSAGAERDARGAGTVKVGDGTVEAGGTKVKTGEEGAEVQAGGAKVKASGDGAAVEAGGVKVGKDGKVTVPGVLP